MTNPSRSKSPAKRHHGSSLDSFLKEEGVFEHVQTSVLASVQATAMGLHKAGVMTHAVLCEFDQLCSPQRKKPVERR